MRYTKEQKEFLNSYIPGHHYKEIRMEYQKRFGHELPAKRLNSYCKNNKVYTGFDGHFSKDHPGYKCPKGTHTSPATEFKKGQKAHNHLEVGTIRTRYPRGERAKMPGKHPEVFIKVAEPNHWDLYSRVLWEQTNGPIPKNSVIAFRNGDSTDVRLENLRLINKSAKSILMRHTGSTGEVRDALMTIGELEHLISERKKAT